MKRIILFSQPNDLDWGEFSKQLFPDEFENKVFAYMPANGGNTKQVYTDYWKNIAEEIGARFVFVDNMLPQSAGESQKIKDANILLISGGNTFELLNNLKKSGLDKAVIDFSKKENFVLAGFSAGALILCPTINICNLPGYDENLVGLTDLSGLKIIDFEVFPHFNPDKDEQKLNEYKKITSNTVKPINDEEYIVLDL